MKYPKIPRTFLKTAVRVVIQSDETSMTGKPITVLDRVFQCNYQSVSVKNTTELERSRGVNAVLLIDEAIDDRKFKTGFVVIEGSKAAIDTISIARNADGTAHHTRITTK